MRRGTLLLITRGSRVALAAAVVCMVASTIGSALAVRWAGATVDALLAGTDARRLALDALIAGLVGSAAWSGSDIFIARLATVVAVRLRDLMVRHTLALPVGFFTERSAGEVTDRISTDVDTIATGLINQVKPIAMGLLGATVAFIVSLTVDVRLTILFVPATIAIAWSATTAGRRVATSSRAIQAEWADAAGTAEEAFGAREDLRQTLGRGLVMRRWAEHATRVYDHVTQMGRDRNRLTLSTLGVLRIFQVAVLVAGATLATQGQLGAGDVWAAFGLVTLFARRIEEVLNSLPKLTEFVAATQRVGELLDETTEPEIVTPAAADDAGQQVRWDEPVTIAFDHVRFSYGAGPTVLDDVTFTVRPGRSLAVVGRTGSGKSTLVRLVNRSQLAGPGQVRIDGVDVRAIGRDELRTHIGVVSQRVELLRASLRDNVTLFDPSIPDERIVAAFGHLGLAAWLDDLPEGLGTVVDHDGVTLSAGEEQLVAFARLLVRNPSIVVLDEATARLDPRTEALLQQATDRLLAGRTSIIIAHRLATIAGVDDVVVLEQGRVTEHGTRRELLERDGSAFGALVEAAGGLGALPADLGEMATTATRPVHRHGRLRRAPGPTNPDADTHRNKNPAPGPAAAPPPVEDQPSAPVPSVAATTWRLLRRHPHDFVPGTFGWIVFFVMPAITAWVWSSLVPVLEPGGDTTPAIVIFSIAGAVGIVGKLIGERYFTRWWMLSNITVRSNLLAAQLHPHDHRVGHRPPSPGDAVNRMWDTNDFLEYADHWLDLACACLFLLTATVLAGRLAIVPWLAAPIVIPVVITWLLRHPIRRVAVEHAHLRGVWSGRVAEVCAAATTIKGFAAEPHVVAHLDELTERRQRAALRQRNLELSIFGSVFLTSEAGQRMVLLLLAMTAVSTGQAASAASVGGAVAISEAIAQMPIAGIVACMILHEAPMIRAKLERLARLLPATAAFDITTVPDDLRLPPASPLPVPTERAVHNPLDRLEVTGVSVVFDDGTRALDDVSFAVDRGQLVIVTGPIASGKSTLLRVLAGLCPPTDGELRWDGKTIDDPSSFLRPPNCAFVSQAPRLVSGTVDENVSLDHDVDVRAALALAELDLDVERAGGVSAVVGHRGLRLSGGQTQRLATARAAAAGSELLVLDDLSSALDVVTERQLWQNLRAGGHTVVATSYKRAALELADQIIVLRDGRIVAIGTLASVDHDHGHLFA